MNPEHKEIAVWAGGAALLVIVGWVVLGTRGTTIEAQGVQADTAHSAYQNHYIGDGERMPVMQALADLREQRDLQATELAAVEQAVLWPGSGQGVPPELAGFRFGADAATTDYATALDIVSRVTSRLRRRSESLGVAIPKVLPFEGQGELSNEDDSLRNLQMAQVCTYAALVDLAIDAGVTRLGPILIGNPWRDATGSYALLPASSVLECSYESADEILRQLEANRFGLGIDHTVLDFQEDGSFRLTLGVRLTVLYHEDWKLGEASATASSPRGGDSGRGTPRGGIRRGVR